MENTEKMETAQNEEYRIEVEDGEKPQNTWFKSGDLGAMLRGLLGMDDGDKPSEEFRTIHTVASFICALKDIQMILVPFGIIPSEVPPEEERDGGLGSTGA